MCTGDSTNAELRVEISQYANMDALEALARAAGFVPADRRIYVVVSGLPTAFGPTGQ